MPMATSDSRYSPIVLDHFQRPRNVGELPDANAQASVTNPACGDVLHLMVKVVDARIVDVRFKTFGCEAAIAASSVLTEMIKGKTLAEAEAITAETITAALGGLPRVKRHASALAEEALQAAIEAYRESQA
jgi:nitrogen fixation NifU-like protein